jgi:transposase
MINRRTVFEIHRLANEGLSARKISRTLRLNRKTVSKYLENPNPEKPTLVRASKLDPFKEQIATLLETDPRASAAVIHQRIASSGFEGGITILKDHLREVRPSSQKKRAFIRFESAPGQQMQVDWGHFGSLSYENTKRKLYCLAVIECHSRLLYLEFTHSQKQETLHRCLLNAFLFFGGTARELVHDNMPTAVTEREGSLVRFNDAFLEFIRPFKIIPLACNVRQAHEKGKVEKGAIHYIRHNFWPLRTFIDLKDVQSQADQWRDHVANIRIHSTTGEKPLHRFQPHALRPLPEFLPDCRDTATAKVHTDFAVRFDANSYTVPPWAINKTVLIKADHHTLTLYYKDKPIATHSRSWQRRARIELPQHREAARKHKQRHWLSQEVAAFISLGEEAKIYIERIAQAGQPLKKSVARLLALKDRYGTSPLREAIKHAISHHAYGANYVENILYQKMAPPSHHPPVRVKNDHLNRIRLEEPLLAEFDAFVLKNRKKP